MYLSVLTRHSLYFYYDCWRLPCFPKCQYFCKCQYIFYFYLSLRRYASWYLAISDWKIHWLYFKAICIFPFWPAILLISSFYDFSQMLKGWYRSKNKWFNLFWLLDLSRFSYLLVSLFDLELLIVRSWELENIIRSSSPDARQDQDK